VSILPKVDPDNPSTFISYKEVHTRLKLLQLGSTYGTSLQQQGMNSLGSWIDSHELPAILGLVVEEGSLQPADGFYKAYEKDKNTDFAWWLGEVKKVKEFDWASVVPGNQVNPGASTTEGNGKNPETASQARTKLLIRDIAQPDSKFFLKSEYGPLSDFWPVVAFSPLSLKSKIQREYRSASDFILYTGTLGADTEETHRGRLLSLVRIDKTRTYDTGQVIPAASWKWANENYSGQWPFAFKVLEGWSIANGPLSKEVVPVAYSQTGRFPNKGSVLELKGSEREAVLDLAISKIDLKNVSTADGTVSLNDLLKDKDLNSEATRIANLVFDRVTASGAIFQGKKRSLRWADAD
jgi:hypothetical protein